MNAKKKKIIAIFVIIIAIVSVSLHIYCKNASKLPVGLQFEVEGLPNIDEFSDTTFVDYKFHFPTSIESAVFLHNGITETISTDDPRLIQLLNFIAYGSSEGFTPFLKGYVYEDEILSCLAAKDPMLEITFNVSDTPGNSTLEKTPQIIICGDSFLAMRDTTDPKWVLGDGMFADRYWPYGCLVEHLYVQNSNVISYDGWGNTYWIDLLEYSGFVVD